MNLTTIPSTPPKAIGKAIMDSAVDVSETLELESSHLDLARRVSSSLGVSASPTKTFTTSSWKVAGGTQRSATGSTSKQLKPFNTEDIKILLLENVNETGRHLLEAQGYQVTSLKKSLTEDELIEKIRWGNALPSSSGTLQMLIWQFAEMFTSSA